MASVAKDYYRVLGVDDDAETSMIDRAYREIIGQLDEEIRLDSVAAGPLGELRQEVVEAYGVLSDPARRADYDVLRESPSWWCDPDDGEPLDVDEMGFAPDRPATLETAVRRFLASATSDRVGEVVDLLLPFEVAALGGHARLRVPVRAACPSCGGTGGEDGAAFQCPDCFGSPMERENCPGCEGRGWRVAIACDRCEGRGWLGALGQLDLDIPAGVSDGTLLPFPGFGQTTSGQTVPRHVRVKVSRHPFFSRKGRDVLCRVPVTEKVAREGTTLKVRTLRGRQHAVEVPPDTHDGTVVRLEGEGIESEGQRGDQLVEIRVTHRSRKKTGGPQ